MENEAKNVFTSVALIMYSPSFNNTPLNAVRKQIWFSRTFMLKKCTTFAIYNQHSINLTYKEFRINI